MKDKALSSYIVKVMYVVADYLGAQGVKDYKDHDNFSSGHIDIW